MVIYKIDYFASLNIQSQFGVMFVNSFNLLNWIIPLHVDNRLVQPLPVVLVHVFVLHRKVLAVWQFL